MKEALRKSKADGEMIEEALKAWVVEANCSRPPKTIVELITLPTIIMDASVEPDVTVDIMHTNDAAA